MATIDSYLSRQSTRPIGCIHRSESHFGGRIYIIGDPIITKYKFNYSVPAWGNHSYSVPVYKGMDKDCPDVVEKLKSKGWSDLTFMTLPNNGYEVDCFEKEEAFKGLGKGEYIGYVRYTGEILVGRSAIEDYIKDNIRDFNPVYVYHAPKNLI